MLRLLPTIVALALVAGSRVAGQTAPTIFDFEQDQTGSAPAGWNLNTQQVPGARAEVVGTDQSSGSRAVVLRREQAGLVTTPVNLSRSIDATPYRGKRVRYRFAARVEPGTRLQLWFRVDLPPQNGQPPVSFFDNMADRPVTGTTWAHHEIVGDIEQNASRIVFGAMAFGGGRAWLDDGCLEIVGDAEHPVSEGPRPLTPRGLVNVTAFAKLLGYVRHFHPSDEAARANWDSIAVKGMRAVEGSTDAAALARQLAAIIGPVAPSVEVFAAGSVPPRGASDAAAGGRMLMWRHAGFGQGTNSLLYRSERVTATAPAVFDVDLGGGVSARIPLTVRADDSGTLPRVPPLSASTVPRPTRDVYPPADRATRLGGVAIAWNVLQHFYPYFDVVKTDWAGELTTALDAAALATDERGYADVLRTLVAALHDGHGRVVSVADPPFVPPVAWEWIEGRLVVVAADVSTGLQPGDAVDAIDGVPVERMLRERERLISGATPQWIRVRAVQELAMGLPQSPVALTVERFSASGRREQVVVTRGTQPQPFTQPRLEKLVELEPGIFYLDLDRLSDADFAAALPRLASARGLVFDLRGYPRLMNPIKFLGHLSQTPMTSAQWHVPQVSAPDRQGTTFVRSGWPVAPQMPYLAARKAFITGGGAISYAESIMGIVEHYQLADIVGAPTAGTNGDINSFPVPGNLVVIFTGMKVLKHDGSQHHGIGIQPTAPVQRTRAGVAAGRDEALERAVQAVKS